MVDAVASEGADGIVEINGWHLYNTKYLRDNQMDYDQYIPEDVRKQSASTCALRQASAHQGVAAVISLARRAGDVCNKHSEVCQPAQILTRVSPLDRPSELTPVAHAIACCLLVHRW